MKKKRKKRLLAIPVVIESTRTGYSAYSPAVLGCIAVGKTLDQTIENMREALSSHIELNQLLEKKIPRINSTLRFAYQEKGDEAIYAVVKLSA